MVEDVDRTCARTGQSGFTLLELLVVVAVLGILGGVSVLAVGSFTDKAGSTACAIDERTLRTAQQAHLSLTGSHGTQEDLVAAGLLRSASTMHDVALIEGSYSLVAVGRCAGNIEEVADGGAESSDDPDPDVSDEPETAAEPESPPTPDPPVEPESPPTPDPPTAPGSNCGSGQVDINSASLAELQKIVHVNQGRAIQIVGARPFSGLHQLEGVGGLNARRVNDIVTQALACV